MYCPRLSKVSRSIRHLASVASRPRSPLYSEAQASMRSTARMRAGHRKVRTCFFVDGDADHQHIESAHILISGVPGARALHAGEAATALQGYTTTLHNRPNAGHGAGCSPVSTWSSLHFLFDCIAHPLRSGTDTFRNTRQARLFRQVRRRGERHSAAPFAGPARATHACPGSAAAFVGFPSMSSHGGAGGSDGQVDGDGGSAPDAGDSGAAAAAPVTRALTALETPVFLRGEVVHGFGRGSKMLGIPTANLPDDVVKEEAGDVPAGVYFGWAAVGDKPKAYKAVMSVGWNPHFKNTKKTVEPHLLHEFEEDFYGEELRLLICGHLRDEAAFSSLGEPPQRVVLCFSVLTQHPCCCSRRVVT